MPDRQDDDGWFANKKNIQYQLQELNRGFEQIKEKMTVLLLSTTELKTKVAMIAILISGGVSLITSLIIMFLKHVGVI